MLLIKTIYDSVWCLCLEWCIVYFLWLPLCGNVALFRNFLSAWTTMSIMFIMMTPCTPWMLRYRRVPTLYLEYVHLAFEAKIWNSILCTCLGGSLYHRIQNLIIYQSLISFNCVVINQKKGEIVSASSPLVGFGKLNDNTIKDLTSLLSVK
jgi:hypothetical protein